MRSKNTLFRNVLNWGVKTAVFVLLLSIAFSPLQINLNPADKKDGGYKLYLEIQTVSADTQAACEQRGGVWQYGVFSDSSCIKPGTLTEPLPEGEFGSNQSDSLSTTAAEWISNIVYVFTVGLGSLIAYVAANFFNYTVFLSLNSTAYAMGFVTEGWVMVRDLANMGFIFILIYIAGSIMLSADTSKTMQMLVRVIGIALIINFSFFFSRVVIDGGNILAVQFYNNIPAPTLGTAASNGPIADATKKAASAVAYPVAGWASSETKDLTANIMGAMQVQSILNTDSFKAFAQDSGFLVKVATLSFIYICMGVIFGLLAAMFFTIGLKFISRVVVLWVVIIASPLALLMYAIPGPSAKKYFNEWLSALITYSLYPATFLFLFFIITRFTHSFTGCDPNAIICENSILESAFGSINKTATGTTGATYLVSIIAEVGIRLGFVMMLLYLALKASDIVSSFGGSLAQTITSKPDKWAASLSGFSQRITRNPVLAPGVRQAAGFGWRNTGGKAAASLASTLKSAQWSNTPGVIGRAGFNLQKKVAAIADSAVPGTLSYKGRSDYLSKTGSEMKANLMRTEDKESAEQVIRQISSNIGSKKTAEVGIDAKALEKIQNMNEARIKELGATQLKTLSHVFTENQMKVVEKLEKMSEQDREEAQKNWRELSSSGPTRKLQKEIGSLRDVIDKLKSKGGFSFTTIEKHTAPGSTIDSEALEEMREEILTQVSTAKDETQNRKNSKDDRILAGKNLEKLQDVTKQLKTLGENLGKAPENKVVVI